MQVFVPLWLSAQDASDTYSFKPINLQQQQRRGPYGKVQPAAETVKSSDETHTLHPMSAMCHCSCHVVVDSIKDPKKFRVCADVCCDVVQKRQAGINRQEECDVL